MKLISASGSSDMQEALSHAYVRTIVDILSQVQNRNFFRLVAQFLKQHQQRTSLKFAQDLEALSTYHLRHPNSEGIIAKPAYVDVLKQTLDDLYRQNEKKVRYQRGAIVELLVRNFVCPRYSSNEFCSGNVRFIDEQARYSSDQVDVAALSYDRYQIEGYECKIKAAGIASEDCTNLTALTRVAQEQGYRTNVGVVSFDNDWLVNHRLKYFESPSYLKPYGLDSIETLRDTPF